MNIYPVPAAVTQAKIQLVIDETAKAPVTTINNDVQAVIDVQRQAEQELLLDRKAWEQIFLKPEGELFRRSKSRENFRRVRASPLGHWTFSELRRLTGTGELPIQFYGSAAERTYSAQAALLFWTFACVDRHILEAGRSPQSLLPQESPAFPRRGFRLFGAAPGLHSENISSCD
jgi:hypothetical protein